MKEDAYSDAVNAHYTADELAAAIQKGLIAIGRGDAVLTPDDLAAIDQFHTRGKDATVEMIEMAGAAPDTRVLDVGGGLGGAARLIAYTHRSKVTVVDITEDFCRVGEALTARASMSALITFRHGSALDLPFADGSFDLTWTQHTTMNVPDKAKLFAELTRVTARTGRIAMHEIVAGPVQPLHFPVMWARTPELSFLITSDELRAHAAAAGLRQAEFRDTTAASLEWVRARAGAMRRIAAGGQRPPLGLHLILGDDFPVMFENQLRNLEENRAQVVMGLWTRM